MRRAIRVLLATLVLGFRATSAPSAQESNDPLRFSSNAGGAGTAAKLSKSIRNWVTCDGVADDTEGAIRAFKAASHDAFTLVVDCPVRIHSGLDIARVIYLDDGTTVEFSGAGRFTVDNVMHPAFVAADSTGITLTNWNVEYDASVPANPDVGGYANNGKFITVAGRTQPSPKWNDLAMTAWLATNRKITFAHGNADWSGPTNTCAVFYITGDTSKMTVTGMRVYVPANAGGDHFVPVVFAFTSNFKSNQTVTAATPRTVQFFAVPHDLIFSNIDLDGTYMGFVGGVQNAIFEHIRSHRYGDLQDANGDNVGGSGKWFAPPHLFYFSYPPTLDPALFNRNISIRDVVDDGPRVGLARDKGGTDTLSGYALSIKIGCVDCSVDGYTTTRPDGFLDVLQSRGLTISNVNATYDSSFLNNLFSGWRFPSRGYSHLTFENISLRDVAVSSIQSPISNSPDPSNESLVFKNVHMKINQWSGPETQLFPNIAGVGHQIALEYTIGAEASRVVKAQNDSLQLTLRAVPATVKAGSAVTLTWTSKGSDTCSALGAWNGALATGGSRSLQLANAGNYDFSLTCTNTLGSSTAIARVIVQ